MDEADKMDRDQEDMERERERHEEITRERESRGETRDSHLEAGRTLASEHDKTPDSETI